MSKPSTDSPVLGTARVLFGMLVLLRTTPVLAPLQVSYLAATSPLLGWPTAAWHVALGGFALPGGIVVVLCVARTIAVVLFTVGVRAREAGVAGGVLGWAVLAQDVTAYINTLHLLYVGLIVLGLAGAGSACAWRPEPESDPRSGVLLTRALVISVYAWSGVAKLNAPWLRGEVLDRLHANQSVRGPLSDALLSSGPACAAAAWALAATELATGPLLLWRPTRRVALVVALAFHAAVQVTVHPDFLGFAMVVLLAAFVELRPEAGRPEPAGPTATHLGGVNVPSERQPPSSQR